MGLSKYSSRAVKQAGGLCRRRNVRLLEFERGAGSTVDIPLSPAFDGSGTTSKYNLAISNTDSRGHVLQVDIVENEGSGQ